MKKYYLGSTDIANHIINGKDAANTIENLEEAIERATDKIREDSSKIVIIVKIVAIVTPDRPPVKVKMVE